MKETNIKNRKSVRKRRELEGIQYTPERLGAPHSAPPRATDVAGSLRKSISLFSQLVKGHQINTGQGEFAGQVRNKKVNQFLSL